MDDVAGHGRTDLPAAEVVGGPNSEAAPGPLALLPGENRARPAVPGFRVGRLLGLGGSSAVWLVTDDDGRRLALKVASAMPGARPGTDVAEVGLAARRGRRAAVPAADGPLPPAHGGAGRIRDSGRQADGPTTVHDLEHELMLLQRFEHEHLLRVHGVVPTDQGPGLLMDLAAGGSLLGLVASRGPLPVPEVVTALVPVAQALDYLHTAGALHGDVTPGNILFSQEGRPVLGDLGTGRLLGSRGGARGGTPGFVDPATAEAFDPGADVFALAAVAWFALTGRIPGPTDQRPPLVLIVPGVPVELMHLIEDGLSTGERRPTADHFARALLASADPDPVDLVPAVHSSVLPELLTRRTEAQPASPVRGWRRIVGIITGRVVIRGRRGWAGGRPAGGRSVAGRAARGRSAARSGASPGQRRAGRRQDAGEGRARGLLAAVAGAAAVVLLVAGLVLTLDGFTTDRPWGETAGPGSGSGSPEGGRSDGLPAGSPAPSVRGGTASGDRSTDGSEGRSTPVPTTASQGTRSAGAFDGDPVAALGALADLRAEAFATADPAQLSTVDVEGSPAMAQDRASVDALAASGVSFPDLSIEIREPVALTAADLASLPALGELPAVAGAPRGTEVSVVRATAALSSYTERRASPAAAVPGAGGGTAAYGAGSPAHAGEQPTDEAPEPGPLVAAGRQELVFILWNGGGGWRIHSVVEPS